MTPAELKAKWIEELRSGKYAQAYHMLFSGDALCCLGLLCVVMGERPKDQTYFPAVFRDDPPISAKVKGMLITMNDYSGKTFPEIADWIETHDLKTGEPL